MEQAVVFSKFRNQNLFQLVLQSGTIVNIHLTKLGDIDKIIFDKVESKTLVSS